MSILAACGAADEANNNGNGEEESLLAKLQEEGTIKVGFANEKPYGYENNEGEKHLLIRLRRFSKN